MNHPGQPHHPDDSRFAPPLPPPPPQDASAPSGHDGYAAAAAPAQDGFAEASLLLNTIRQEVSHVFIGQQAVLDQALAALLAGGHVLVEGLPGLGKTHLVVALAKTMGGQFKRIQFTPDLMPSDVMGHSLYDMSQQAFRLRKGPVFANFVLADEINRAPAKTQSALLEVMQETQVTIDGESMPLPPPFMVLATQNPIEQEGTYPLPEAQLDRFLMKILIGYPSMSEEERIVSQVASARAGGGLSPASIRQLCDPEDIVVAQNLCAAVRAVPDVVNYAVRLVRATREAQGISLGAGTRGAIALVRVAKAFALIQGRDFITPDDVKAAVPPVLRHRVQLAPELAISGQQVDHSLELIVRKVEAPRQ
jgi:MoxR-like ATPase